MDRIAHYHILDRIGAGGMGEVYRARDTRLGRTVALKVLPEAVAGDAARRERFLREAQASAALSHPNICALFEVGEEDDRVYLVFEYVPGETLRHAIHGRPLNVRVALDAAIQLADALADAHAAGIVHRDLKPDNIIITPKGHPKILDFGLASFTEGGAVRESAATGPKTAEGLAVATVAYMSPEQALGVGFDHRTDIFSLGIVFHEMLTGSSPFKALNAAGTALKIAQSTPPPPSTINRTVPKELDAIVARMLAKDPKQRYETAATLAAELRSVAAILDVREVVELERTAEASSTWWRTIVSIVLLGALALGSVWLARGTLARLRDRWFGPPPAPVIAVMPLDLIGGDPGRRYFADGLTEDLITRIGQLPGVKVLGRSATREHSGRHPAEVARELNAAAVLTGAVQTERDRVQVNVALVDPDAGTQIWGERYERALTDVFAVQTEIAEAVAKALRVTLAPSAARARTAARRVDATAYDLYLRGRAAAAERQVDRAIELYRQAIDADPGLAEAHAGLAEALYLSGVFLGRLTPALAEETRRVAMTAAAADPDLPQAQLALGLTEVRLGEALGRFRRAIEIDPSYAEAYHQVGDQLMEFDPARALSFYRRSLALDPRAAIAYVDTALIHASAGRAAEAAEANRHAPPEIARGVSAIIALHAGTPADAVRIMLDADRQFPFLDRSVASGLTAPSVMLASALQQSGRHADALARAELVVEKAPADCAGRAMLAALRFEAGRLSEARALAAPSIAAAREPAATRGAVRCGPMAAAAVNDGVAAGAILTRIASEEEHLRDWVLERTGLTGHAWLRRGWFPFDRIAADPAVRDARAALERAFARQRDLAGTVLAGLLEGSASTAAQ